MKLPPSFKLYKVAKQFLRGMFMREFLIVTGYAAFMLMVMAVVLAFFAVTSPVNACKTHIDGSGNIVRC